MLLHSLLKRVTRPTPRSAPMRRERCWPRCIVFPPRCMLLVATRTTYRVWVLLPNHPCMCSRRLAAPAGVVVCVMSPHAVDAPARGMAVADMVAAVTGHAASALLRSRCASRSITRRRLSSGTAMDAAAWTVTCCRCLGVRRRMQLPAYDHRRPLVRNDEPGNPHAPARLYGVSMRRAGAPSSALCSLASQPQRSGRKRGHRGPRSGCHCPRSRVQVVPRHQPLWTWLTRSSTCSPGPRTSRHRRAPHPAEEPAGLIGWPRLVRPLGLIVAGFSAAPQAARPRRPHAAHTAPLTLWGPPYSTWRTRTARFPVYRHSSSPRVARQPARTSRSPRL